MRWMSLNLYTKLTSKFINRSKIFLEPADKLDFIAINVILERDRIFNEWWNSLFNIGKRKISSVKNSLKE